MIYRVLFLKELYSTLVTRWSWHTWNVLHYGVLQTGHSKDENRKGEPLLQETCTSGLGFGVSNLFYSKNFSVTIYKYTSAWVFGVQSNRNCSSLLPQSLITFWSDPVSLMVQHHSEY